MRQEAIIHRQFDWKERRDYMQYVPALEHGDTVEIPCASHEEAQTVRFAAVRSLKRIGKKVRSSVRDASVFLAFAEK